MLHDPLALYYLTCQLENFVASGNNWIKRKES